VTGIILYAIGLLPQTYFVLLKPLESIDFVWKFLKWVQNIMVTTRNGVFFGFLFMGIGMYFAYKPIVMKYTTAIIGLVASIILFFAEVLMVNFLDFARVYDMYIGLIPVTFFLFYIALHTELEKHKAIYKHLRYYSSMIFYLHLLVAPLIKKVLNLLDVYVYANGIYPVYALTIFVIIILTECIIKLSEHPHLKWLKLLYS
jgi:hypothetical protein